MNNIPTLIAASILCSAGIACTDQSANKEPSEAAIREALIRTIEANGINRSGPNTLTVDNPINGIDVNIEALEKIACQRADDGNGHFCTYVITTSFSYHANDGTAGTNRHAQAANALLSGFMGERQDTSTNTSRFVRRKGEWFAFAD